MIQIGLCDDDLAILSQLQVLLDRYQVERNAEITSAAFQSPLELLAEIEKGSAAVTLADCRTGFFGTLYSAVLRLVAPLC